MQTIRNQVLNGPHGRPILWDANFVADGNPKPGVLFVHGFKGFKDWGCWSMVGEQMALDGFVFFKFNLSHNGTTLDDPLSFGDLEAFGQNNYSKELDDIGAMIDLIRSGESGISSLELNSSKIHLVGHSRGGGMVLLKAAEDPRVHSLSTWASISAVDRGWTEDLVSQWRELGVLHIMNGRTKQQMPLYYQLYQDVQLNKGRLNISERVKVLNQALLVVHGKQDPAVKYEEALDLTNWKPDAELLSIEGGDHVFGARHEWDKKHLPSDLQKVVKATSEFFKRT